MGYMYGGTILRIDLTDRKISKEPTSSYAADFLGGRGINVKMLYDAVPAKTDPYDPASPIIFGIGPLAGTPVPSSRVEVTGHSPETTFLGTSNFGGYFGPELKFAGYDHLYFTGQADKPVYLFIYNDQIEIRDASHLWGLDSFKTQEVLRAELGNDFKVACIGQGGEHLVHYASIQHELKHGSGRTGMGGIMGSKKLKAIVVRGTKGVALANPQKYLEIAQEVQAKLRAHPAVQEKQKRGSAVWLNTQGMRRAERLGEKTAFSSEAFFKYQDKVKRAGCFGCPVQCMELYPPEAAGGGAISCTFYLSPFYEVRNTDPDAMLEFSFMAQRYGVDVATAMKIIAWLMMLYEKGVITSKDTDGIPMEWGNVDSIRQMFKKIAFREGIGDVLADGLLQAAKKLNWGMDKVYHMKGLPLYDLYTPEEVVPAVGDAFAITMSSRGDNMKVRVGALEDIEASEQSMKFPDEKSGAAYVQRVKDKVRRVTGTEKAFDFGEYEGKPELVAYMEEAVILGDCLSACKFCGSFLNYPFQEPYYVALYNAGMGVDTSEEQLFNFAKKIKTMERAYNAREGMDRRDDSLPKAFMDKEVEYTRFDYSDKKTLPLLPRTGKLDSVKFEQMKDRYYQLRGWDIKTGIPTRETLQKYGLDYIADDLEKLGKLPQTAKV